MNVTRKNNSGMKELNFLLSSASHLTITCHAELTDFTVLGNPKGTMMFVFEACVVFV